MHMLIRIRGVHFAWGLIERKSPKFYVLYHCSTTCNIDQNMNISPHGTAHLVSPKYSYSSTPAPPPPPLGGGGVRIGHQTLYQGLKGTIQKIYNLDDFCGQ